MKLRQQFADYLAAVYPDPPRADDPDPKHREQHRQIEQAFMAGAMLAIMASTEDVAEYMADLQNYGIEVAMRIGGTATPPAPPIQ